MAVFQSRDTKYKRLKARELIPGTLEKGPSFGDPPLCYLLQVRQYSIGLRVLGPGFSIKALESSTFN